MPALAYAHIELREGVPYVAGTRTKVIQIALDLLAHGWDADEIHLQHPHLSLGQIHSALAYYYDHREELDRDIEVRRRSAPSRPGAVDIASLRGAVCRGNPVRSSEASPKARAERSWAL